MARIPRKISEYGYYHLCQQGNGQQIIFEEDADYIHFLHLLKAYGIQFDVKICAFCLMENHFHLLVCDREQHISDFMKNLTWNYAIWFNLKYHRRGHLFQGRYRSKAIESENALCSVFRYILNNPRDAGICPASEYKWSSYKRYGQPESFVDTKILTELLGSFQEYAEYLDSKYEDEEPEFRNHDDAWAKQVMENTLGVQTGAEIKQFDRKSRNEAIRTLRDKGLSVRQIERLTGISKGVIQRA